MIPVSFVAEPPTFDKKVRIPGTAFLSTTPNPTRPQWQSNDYWRKALGELFTAYSRTCSYCGSWTKRSSIPQTPQDSSVDHFVPKSVAPFMAYEWGNYRLCRTRLNNRKGNHQDVIDPFTLSPRWFTLDFQTFLIAPNPTLSATDQALVVATIDRFELNIDNDYVNERIGAIHQYCLGNATLAQLQQTYPFIATEMQAQDFDTNFLPRLKAFWKIP